MFTPGISCRRSQLSRTLVLTWLGYEGWEEISAVAYSNPSSWDYFGALSASGWERERRIPKDVRYAMPIPEFQQESLLVCTEMRRILPNADRLPGYPLFLRQALLVMLDHIAHRHRIGLAMAVAHDGIAAARGINAYV